MSCSQSIVDLVNELCKSYIVRTDTCVSTTTHIYTVDVSGSTTNIFDVSGSIDVTDRLLEGTVLHKERVELRKAIASHHLQDKVFVNTFSCFPSEFDEVRRMDNGFFMIPSMEIGGMTQTVRSLQKILDEPLFKGNRANVTIITDGQTNSYSHDVIDSFKALIADKKTISIIAIDTRPINLETISREASLHLPGMDLVNCAGNLCEKLTIFNAHHNVVPYVASRKSSADKKRPQLLGCDLPKGIILPIFLDLLVDKISEKRDSVTWGNRNCELQVFCSEIGVLLTLLFVDFTGNCIADMISKRLHAIVPSIPKEEILAYIEYGFMCSRKQKPLMFTGFSQQIAELKETSTKQGQFGDATQLLKREGSTLGDIETITFTESGFVAIDKSNVVPKGNSWGSFPKSCDENLNPWFGTSHPQAIRQALRQHFNDPRSPNVIFRVLSLMGKLFLADAPFGGAHMSALRKLAVIQTSMEVMVSQGKYSGIGCYDIWKTGGLVAMHFSKKDTHVSLYADHTLNPLCLSEPIWWAFMMAMLGIFDEQKPQYQGTLGCDTIEEFLNYMKSTYSSKLDTKFVFKTFESNPKSLFTFDDFPVGARLYSVTHHRTPSGQLCTTPCWVSEGAELDYICANRCPWCRTSLSMSNVERITNVPIKNDLDDGKQAYISFPRISLDEDFPSLSLSSKKGPTPKVVPRQSVSAPSFQQGGVKLRIDMIGCTGAGKTTATEILSNEIIKRGGKVLVVSADKWSKLGRKPAAEIPKEIRAFESVQSLLKVVIVDICNDRGVTRSVFGQDFGSWKQVTFKVNLDESDLIGYESFCLTNVLARGPFSPSTKYWLTKQGVGVEKVIEIHNSKINGVFGALRLKRTHLGFNPRLSENEILYLIEADAERYAMSHTLEMLEMSALEILNSNI